MSDCPRIARPIFPSSLLREYSAHSHSPDHLFWKPKQRTSKVATVLIFSIVHAEPESESADKIKNGMQSIITVSDGQQEKFWEDVSLELNYDTGQGWNDKLVQ